MEIVESIKRYLSSKKDAQRGDEIVAPDGVCPNCWGRQEYEGHLYEKIGSHNVQSRNMEVYTSFIKEFVKKHLQPILLKQTASGYVCVSCESKNQNK